MGDPPTALGGTCSARFDSLRELFAAKLESGEDLGASLAVNLQSKLATFSRTARWHAQSMDAMGVEVSPTCFLGNSDTQ